MQRNLTSEDLSRYQQAREFALTNLSKNVRLKDKRSIFDRNSWQKAADFGVLGWRMPKKYGGSDLSFASTICALEGLGYGCSDNGLTLGLNGQMWSIHEPILNLGSKRQKEKYLPKLCSGEMIGCHAMTEKESGSDSFNCHTQAQQVDDGYLINGSKSYLGLAPVADLALVFAKTSKDLGPWGISAFLVETATDGASLGSAVDKLGLRSIPMGDIVFKNCFVSHSQRLGPEGVGMSLFNQTMDFERGFVFASHIGSMARQLDQCITYAKKRKQFNQPISKFQSVSNRITNMKSRLEISRLLIKQVADLQDQRKTTVIESSLAKLHISEAFYKNSMDAIRIHGAVGYLSEYEVERDLRDAAGGVIYSGTSDIQRNIISTMLGL